MLSCLSPVEVVGEGGLGEPIVCVGGLNETLGSGDNVSQGFMDDGLLYWQSEFEDQELPHLHHPNIS